MIGLLRRLFASRPPVLSAARPRDAGSFAALHAASFHRGWSEEEFGQLLTDRNVIADRATTTPESNLVGFILSRLTVDEAEILSVAVTPSWRGRGLAGDLLSINLRRLAGCGARTVFLEVDEANTPARRLYARAAFREVGRRAGYYEHGRTALILRRDLA